MEPNFDAAFDRVLIVKTICHKMKRRSEGEIQNLAWRARGSPSAVRLEI